MITTAHAILEHAQAAMTSRAKDRDSNDERSMNRCVEAFNALTNHKLSERDGWLFMAVLKIARAATTRTGIMDDYVDGAAYMALAGESTASGDTE